MKLIKPGKLSGEIKIPGSKSIIQRALACSLFAEGESQLSNINFCNDVKAVLNIVKELGSSVKIHGNKVSISPNLNFKNKIINCGESGLALRMFTQIASLSPYPVKISGRGSLLKRKPNIDFDLLKKLGTKIKTNKNNLPFEIQGPLKANDIKIDCSNTSQFLTGLLITLPNLNNKIKIVAESLQSKYYIDLTIDILSEFGIKVDRDLYTSFFIPKSSAFKPVNLKIEGDWSSAAFFIVAAILGNRIEIENLNFNSKQADIRIMKIIKQMTAFKTTDNKLSILKTKPEAFSFDAVHCPDLLPILTVLASQCGGTSKIKGISRLYNKESNRAEVILNEFSKIGINVRKEDDYLIVKKSNIKGGIINSHNDHRIAMSAAIAGLISEHGVKVVNEDSVNKSYPDFWEDLDSLRKN